jgi:hypothetical protein
LNYDGLIEAFDARNVLLGTFEDEDDAAIAISDGCDATPKAAGNGADPSPAPNRDAGGGANGPLTVSAGPTGTTEAADSGVEPTPLAPDRDQLNMFARALFKHATPGFWLSLQAFYENDAGRPPFRITPVQLAGDPKGIIDLINREMELAARAHEKVAFCPPIATFTNPEHAREEDLAEGLALSVAFGVRPQAARTKLETLLGPATAVVASGGVWTNPETGETEPKLYNHWRLKVPASTKDAHRKLELARRLAAKLVSSDPSNEPVVLPICWPGSVHRKGEPKLCRNVELNPDAEIDLDTMLEILKEAANRAIAAPQPRPQSEPVQEGGASDELPDEVSTAPDPATPELTLFVNAHGALTKQFTLDANGDLVATEGGQMAEGTALRIAVGDVQALADLIGTISSDQALALGAMRSDLPAQVTVVTKKALNSGTVPDTISRSRDYLTFGQERRGFCLGDFDRKGITAEVRNKLEQSGGFVAALGTVIPELKTTGCVVRASTSAGLFRTDTGHRFVDSGGIHLYLGIKDVSDSERFLKTLHDRCWLMGLGWYAISAAGTLLARSIIDRAVATPEHLCFEGPPLLGPGLAQDKAARMPKVVNGDWLDTRAACPPLNTIEQSRLKELQTKAAFALKAECARVRTAWLKQRTTEIAARCGVTEQVARRIAIKHADGVLLPAVELTFADPAIGVVTVGAVLADPDKYVDEPLADPWEGPSYGRQTAKVLRRPDGSIFVNSFAHGGQTFELKFDVETISKILSATAASNVVETMINHVLAGSLDEIETDTLVRQAAEQAKVGLRPVQQKLKQARMQRDKQQEAEKRAMALMNRTDLRPQRDAPAVNAPWLPEMEAYDAILKDVVGDIPPSRHIEDELNCVRCTVVPGTHAFSSDGADDPPAPGTFTSWITATLPICWKSTSTSSARTPKNRILVRACSARPPS